MRERTVASQERELEVCRRWLFFTYVYGGFSNHKLSWELDWLDFGTVFNPLALESMSQGANLKSMLDLRAALWLVWLVPQPTFFQGHMSTLFGSLASKKKGVGEGWSLDTWKRDQGLLMLDKSFKASGNSSVLCKEERKAEAAQEEACQELKVIDYTWQATFVRTVKQTRNYQLLFQLEKKSRWSQCIFSGGSTGTRPSQGEHRAQKATSDVGWQVSPLFLSAFKSFVSR